MEKECTWEESSYEIRVFDYGKLRQSEGQGRDQRRTGPDNRSGSISEAAEIAARLEEEGVGCIELCGAFGEEGARAVIEATKNRIPVGYVTHLPEQEEVYRKAFSK